VVLNLLSNAFKFTHRGSIGVSLRAQGGAIALEVQDTGVGIAAEELPHIFERFYRVKHDSGRSYEGSGIGLALVQDLVRPQGGAVTVESEPGRGSGSRVPIPRGSAHLPAERIGAARDAASTAMGAGVFVEEAMRWLPEDAPEPGTNPAAA